MDDHRNRDGLRGALANAVRYVVANQNVGVDIADPETPVGPALSSSAAKIVRFLGLENAGYRSDFDDANSPFLKEGKETASDFGPVGGLAILACPGFLLILPFASVVARLAACAGASLFLVAGTVAWMPWNARFLLLPFILASLALTLRLVTWPRAGRLLLGAWLAPLLFSAFAYPWCSTNKGPQGIKMALTHRRTFEMLERPEVSEIVSAVNNIGKAVPPTAPRPVVWISAGGNSWILPFLRLRSVQCIPKPTLTADALRAYAASQPRPWVLLLDVPPRELSPLLRLEKRFWAPDCGLYEAVATPLP